MSTPTDLLREVIATMYVGDVDASIDRLKDLLFRIEHGRNLPVIEVLGPDELRNPDVHRVRVAI